MFDGSLPGIADLPALDDAGLVDVVRGWARAENAACNRKQAVMAELFARRTGLDADERELWWVDPEAAVDAELAAQNISRGLALHQTHRGVALRDRLPKVAALFEAGVISDLLVRTIVWRTYLIDDAAAMAAVDAELAAQVTSWGALSVNKTEQAIDALVDAHDPGALRRSRATYCRRDVAFGSPSDEAGFTSLWARLYAPDAAVLERRVTEIAHSVGEQDPRTAGERRADALTALAAGQNELACDCGNIDRPAAQRPAPPNNAVVHVVAQAATVTAASAPGAQPAPTPAESAPPVPEVPASATPAPPVPEVPVHTPAAARPSKGFPDNNPCPAPPAFVIGGGVLPAPLLSAVLDRASVRQIRHPGDGPPEPRYTPSRELADFVRCRDLTCRWPGCDRPAYECDLDHTVPYPVGPTHASNLKCCCRLCRRRHNRHYADVVVMPMLVVN